MKNLSIPMASSILIFGMLSCQKESLTPTNEPLNPAIEEVDNTSNEIEVFKHSSEMEIFDESGEYSVTYRIESDSKEVFENAKTTLESATIELKKELSERPSDANLEESEEALSEPLEEDGKGLYLTEITRNTGSARGYRMNIGDESSRVWVGPFCYQSSMTINSNTACLWIDVYNQDNNNCYGFNYTFDGWSWSLRSVYNQPPSTAHAYSAGGYSVRRVTIQTSHVQGGVACNAYLLFEVNY